MDIDALHSLAQSHLHVLCEEVGNRCVGKVGNRATTDYLQVQLADRQWAVETQAFAAVDWTSHGASLHFGTEAVEVFPSPYSPPITLAAPSRWVSTREELETVAAQGCVLVLSGELCKEQLMPRNFPFYKPPQHQQLLQLIEQSGALALAFVVNEEGFYQGGEYPFPIIEDGDFPLPSVFMSATAGAPLLRQRPHLLQLTIHSNRSPASGMNVIGSRGPEDAKRLVLTAHLDAKQGSPGALDNASGVTTLLLLAELLRDYQGPYRIELTFLNGEDYYSAPGQCTYLQERQTTLDQIALNINIDGVGYWQGPTSWSAFHLSEPYAAAMHQAIAEDTQSVIGGPWYQGDHSIFLQSNIPAIAISSAWLLEHLTTQRITHTSNDQLSILEIERLLELSLRLHTLLETLK
jgi:aminopeptidase YwaD